MTPPGTATVLGFDINRIDTAWLEIAVTSKIALTADQNQPDRSVADSIQNETSNLSVFWHSVTAIGLAQHVRNWCKYGGTLKGSGGVVMIYSYDGGCGGDGGGGGGGDGGGGGCGGDGGGGGGGGGEGDGGC